MLDVKIPWQYLYWYLILAFITRSTTTFSVVVTYLPSAFSSKKHALSKTVYWIKEKPQLFKSSTTSLVSSTKSEQLKCNQLKDMRLSYLEQWAPLTG